MTTLTFCFLFITLLGFLLSASGVVRFTFVLHSSARKYAWKWLMLWTAVDLLLLGSFALRERETTTGYVIDAICFTILFLCLLDYAGEWGRRKKKYGTYFADPKSEAQR